MTREPASTDDEDMAWARAHAQNAPRWSDAKWRRVNAVLGVEVSTREGPVTIAVRRDGPLG
jgi:hypothetical protein